MQRKWGPKDRCGQLESTDQKGLNADCLWDESISLQVRYTGMIRFVSPLLMWLGVSTAGADADIRWRIIYCHD